MIEIGDVSPAPADDRLWGHSIDSPSPGSEFDAWAIKIQGWVLGRSSPVVSVDLLHRGRLLRRANVAMPRPTVAERFGGVPSAQTCGFGFLSGVIGLPPSFTLVVRAALADGGHVLLGSITGRHRPLDVPYTPVLAPLLVTSLGRSGSTWLMRLLAEHPMIVAYRHYPYELPAARYWMHMLRVLAEPANPLQSTHPLTFAGDLWHVGNNPFYGGHFPDRRLAAWLGGSYTLDLAAFCLRSIDGFYGEVARAQHQPDARYFAEKHLPDHIPDLTWELYPEGRELILVRDPRDVLCSMLASAERGYPTFYRETVASDTEFAHLLRSQVARLLQAIRDRPQAHLVHYEELIEHPAPTLAALLAHAGLDAAAGVVAAMLGGASQSSAQLDAHPTSSGPRASIGRWRRHPSAEVRAACEECFGDVLGELGYDESTGGTTTKP